ncbi:PAS domain-containing protein [Virgisporangium ochraceum]|uniref:protein-glutamate O-methyltransferase n=1 Tax=Virgisporangium ochraceum TaxID=65505 RepID=A0A8J3ZPK8_9ACTN|nr:CheR family methyltransferase [Virgisporangium ochraceum]GIJ65558.1 chemotaxis protein CheR [Virgisporangium ochraceum]
MTQPDPQFEALLIYLKESRGFDFTGYKRSSLMRRVGRRMSQAGFETYPEYLDYLQVHPDEFTALFNTILINVTGFFRDPEAWDHLRAEILPMLVRGSGPIRVWSAGCASGQEAYTLAIAFAEALGVETFRQRVKIYATDVDEDGLTQARQASYTEREMAGLPQDIVERYFDTNRSRFTFRSDLRRSVIFGRNDLIQDAPISRIDLLVCRNALMYFNAEAQSRILARFHFALSDNGVLFLGKAEMLLSHGDLFVPADLKRRIFRKVPRHLPANGPFHIQPVPSRPAEELSGLDRVRTEAFLASPVAQVVVTGDGLVALTNRQAEMMFGVSARDVGRPFRDLELSYRPVELRGYIEQAQVERRPQRVTGIEYGRGPDDVLHLEVQVNPLVDSESRLLGVVLVFLDVTAGRRLRDELEHANRQLETAYEELQSTNEELETTNEELQSTVEELETTNEELQSTNEELETMNEELQSANDELQAINDELRDRTAERDSVNAFLETVFVSLKAGVVVINQDLQVRVWNRRCEDLWGLRAEEAVGRHFLNLDIGLPTDQLRPMIRKLLGSDDGSQEIRLASVNRRGRQIEVKVMGTPLRRDGDGTPGVILIMESVEPVV